MAKIQKVIDPLKIVTDPVLLAHLSRRGIDKDYVELTADYGKRIKGKSSPYAKFYRDLKTGRRFAVFSQLPMVDAEGNKLEPGWEKTGNQFKGKNNLFNIDVRRDIKITLKNDQPDGGKKGDQLVYSPQLFLNEVEQAAGEPVLLAADPFNPNYAGNVLEWDYGICQRRLRLIEGQIIGSWHFSKAPRGKVKIKYNQSGNFRLKLGKYKSGEDEELIPADVFSKASYPFIVNDSITVYPDANPETSTVDGYVYHYIAAGDTWATIRDGAGTGADATNNPGDMADIYSDDENDKWQLVLRSIFLFDTSAIDDTAGIVSATLSVYGQSKTDPGGWAPTFNAYSSAPASNTALAAGDFDSLGSTAFCDTAITYAGYNTGGYNDFALNAAGKAAISKTGITKLGIREATYDVPNSAPAWAASKSLVVKCYYAEQGVGFKPKLVVEYQSPPDAPTNLAATDGTHLDKVKITWTQSPTGIDYKVNRDGVDITGWLGDVDEYDDEDIAPPVIDSGGTIQASKNRYFQSVKLKLSGESISPGAEYTYKVKCKDALGTESSYSATDTGYRSCSTIAYQLQRSAADSNEAFSDVGGAFSDKYFDYDAPAYPAGRYYRYKLTSLEAEDAYSTVDRGYRRDSLLPPVIAAPVIIIKNTAGEVLCHVKDAANIPTEEAINLLNQLSFTIPAGSEAVPYLDEDNEVWLYFNNEIIHIYRIVGEEGDILGARTVTCLSIGHDLTKSILLDGYSCALVDEKTPADVLDDLLANQEVEVITLGGVIMATSEIYIAITIPAGTDIWEACKLVRDAVGGYLTIEVDPEDTTLRELWLRDVIGQQSGQQIRFKKNLTSLKHTRDYIEKFNRIYPIGDSDLRLNTISYSRQNTEPETDATYAYIRLRNQYEAYTGWTGEGDALPGNITIEKPTGAWFSPPPFTSYDQINPPYGYGTGWVDEALAYDDNINTYARCGTVFTNPVPPGGFSKEIRFFCPATTTSQLFIKGSVLSAGGYANASLVIKVQAAAAWETIYTGTFGSSETITSLEAYFSSRDVTGVSFLFYNWNPLGIMIWLNEVNLWDPVGLNNDTANWEQGEDERTCRIDIGSYIAGVGYVISYTHATYLIDLEGITDRRQIRSKYQIFGTADIDELIARGRQALAEGNKTINSIDAGLIDLSQYEGYDFDALTLGSVLRLIHSGLDIDEEHQLVRIVRTDLHRPELVRAEFAARTKTIIDMI